MVNKKEQSPDLPDPDGTILEADIFQSKDLLPVRIKLPRDVLDRLGKVFEKRGEREKLLIAGGLAVVAVGTVAGVAVREHFRRRRERGKEEPVPLSEEQTRIFGEIYEKHVGKIKSYLYYRLGNPQEAEDLTGTVFERALRAFPRFEPYQDLKDPYKAWLYRIAFNVSANYRRDKGRRPELALEEIGPRLWEELVGKEDKYEIDNEDKVRLREAISSLPEEHQLLLWLKSEGFSNKEIGHVLGTTESAIKTRYFRVLSRLEKKLH